MDEKTIVQYMQELNKWWLGSFDLLGYKEREIDKQLKKFMKTKQIIALTGLRRVGKTTAIFKIIKDYLDATFQKDRILYFSFDEFAEVRIRRVIEIYEKLFNINISSGKYLIALDEIQKVKNWAEQLKSIYDLYPNIKFIISGSESLFIRKKSRESLAGRIFQFLLTPLSFREFLAFRNVRIENNILQEKQIKSEFTRYLITNGFPEIINEEKEIARKYIQEGIIDKVIYRDMAEVFGIKNPQIIKSTFNIIYHNPGQIIEIQGLSKDIGITRQALSEHLEYLEQSFLIKKLYNYSRNARKTERRLKKYYSTITNQLLLESEFPKVFEQALVNQLNADFFWRDAYKNEIDIIKTFPLSAIEIKSGGIKEKDLKPLNVFIKKFKPKKAFVISYDQEKNSGKINIIPFYKFLLSNKN